MSLTITFHRAANAEFIDASSWYEGKRIGLGAEFIAEVESCLEVISENPLRYPCVHQNIRSIAVSKNFLIAFTFVLRNIALLFWLFFTVVEIQLFGKAEPKNFT